MARPKEQTLEPVGGRTGFTTIELIGRIVLNAIMKFWALCTTTLLMLLLLFWLYGGLVTLLLLVVAVIGLLYNAQDSLLYYPDQPAHARFFVDSPSSLGLPFENVNIKTKDGVKINMFFIKQPPHVMGTVPTILYLHGNAGNIGHRLLNAHAMYTFSGTNVLLVEYRGYGKSQGSASENGLYQDAQAAFDFLLQQTDIDTSKIMIFGRSLGGAVAIHLGSQPHNGRKAMCLVVENTFTTLPDIAKQLFDFKILSYLPRWCFKNQYPSLSRIAKVHLPTLFISGMADALIPPAMMQELYQTSGSMMRRLARFEAGTHNETWQCQGYYETLNRFLAEVYEHNGAMKNATDAVTYSIEVPFDDNGVFQV